MLEDNPTPTAPDSMREAIRGEMKEEMKEAELTMTPTPDINYLKAWAYGLLVAFANGAFVAGLLVIAGGEFDLSKLKVAALASGAAGAVSYLKKSPLH